MFTFGGGFGASSLPALAAEMGQTLSGIAGQVQTRWNKQHKSDGSHGDVTATTMRAGQIGANGILQINAGNDFFPAPLDVPAGVGVVQILTLATFAHIIYGIRQAGQQHGDILFVGLAPNSPEALILADRGASGSAPIPPLGTEIAFENTLSPAYLGPAPWQFVIWSPQSPVMLIYLPGRGTNGASAWCIPQFFSTT